MKRVRAFAAAGVDHHAHRERRAIFVGPQRAQIVGDALRQHRHHAVGEIDRIAAFDRSAVERRAGPHIMRHVGDRDGHHMAARVARVGVGQGVDGVVMVLGVGRVDGDERGVAPVFVLAEHPRARGVGFLQHGAAETMRNAVGVDRDQADRLFARERAEPLNHLAGRQPEPALARNLDGDQIAVLGAAGCIGRDVDFPAELFLVDRHQTDAAVRHAAENAERAVLGAVDQLDDAAARAVFVRVLDADERAVADAGHFAGLGAARRCKADNRGRAVRVLVPFRRPRQKFAVGVAAGDVGEHHRGQGAAMMHALAAVLDLTLVGEFAQHVPQRRPVGVLGAEGAGDLAGADLAAMFANEGEKFLAGRQVVALSAAELRRSNAELEQFAYVASHDLQEPLRKVASFCQLLEKRYSDKLDDRGRQYIDFAVDGAKRLQVLINDLLTFSRVGRASDVRALMPLGTSLDAAITALGAAIEDSGAVIDTPEQLPEVMGDPTLLAMVWQNLIANAIKFRAPDRPPVVRITVARQPEGMWLICVADNGIGIAPEFAEKVFVIFQRLHGRDAYPGAGIGLALCRRIIEHHGGAISLDTSYPDGTRICFTLPCVEPAEPGSAGATGSAGAGRSADAAGPARAARSAGAGRSAEAAGPPAEPGQNGAVDQQSGTSTSTEGVRA